MGPAYGRSQAQIGVKDYSYFCFLCQLSLADGAEIEAHLCGEDHASLITKGEEVAAAKAEEEAAAEAAAKTENGN